MTRVTRKNPVVTSSDIVVGPSSFTSIEMGGVGVTDTTLTRSAAGRIAVEGAEVVDVSTAQVVSNKAIRKRSGTIASAAVPSINIDTTDYYTITALTVNITGWTITGTGTEGQQLWIAITGTASRSIVWGTPFEGALLPSTTSGTTRLDVGFVFNSATGKLRCVSVQAT